MYVFRNGTSSLTKEESVFLCRRHVCCTVVSARVYDRCHGVHVKKVKSYVTTDGQSASLSWREAHIWGPRPDFYYCQTLADLLMWGALSDEMTGLSTIAAGPRQRNHSRVRVPRDM
jgi:hypothetical protein